MAKASIHFATDSEVVTHLGACVLRANAEGIDLRRHGALSKSKVIRTAIRFGYEASVERMRQPAPVALPEKAGTADADRLRAAMGTMAPIEVCRAAGLKDSASIRNVVNKGAALAGKLLAWVESREAAR